MPVIFPVSPSVNDVFDVAGKSFFWDASSWRRLKNVIIDGGDSSTEITLVVDTYDGGDA
jgi:hypothetical protein